MIIVALFAFVIPIAMVAILILYIEGKMPKRKPSMSQPAKIILKRYKALPAEHRPAVDIVNILKTLDTKYGIDKVNRHYAHRYDYSAGVDLSSSDHGSCYTKSGCTMREYRHLYESINQVAGALEAQERRTKVAILSQGIDTAAFLIEQLRNERDIINEATDMIVGTDA